MAFEIVSKIVLALPMYSTVSEAGSKKYTREQKFKNAFALRKDMRKGCI